MAMIKIPFNAWSEERLQKGLKVCTSRTKKYGEVGDMFYSNHARHVIQEVLELPLWFVRDFLWWQEGAESPEDFEEVWRGIFRGKFDPFTNPKNMRFRNEQGYKEDG